MQSLNEQNALKGQAFFQPQDGVDGVLGADGIPSENLRVDTIDAAAQNFVKDCSANVILDNGQTQSRYDWERDLALKEASEDSEQKTVPVEYAISFGVAEDRLAYWAHWRSILSNSNPNYSIIPVGDKDAAFYTSGGTQFDAYYKADHAKAKTDYIKGQRCFFNTVKLTSDIIKSTRPTGVERYKFIMDSEPASGPQHGIHYMFFGYCEKVAAGNNCAKASSPYGEGAYGAGGYPNRLFGAWPHKESGAHQIVKLYVADIREKHLGLGSQGRNVIKVPESAARGSELQLNIKEQMDLTVIHQNFNQAIRNLSRDYQGANTFSGMVGMPQLLMNLISAGVDGTVLASQYTPIVLDLGKSKVRTSGTFAGTYFDMALLSSTIKPHQTAWLGGALVDVEAEQKDGAKFNMDVRRISDDGFLVIPESDGLVKSSKNLFGDQMIAAGKKHANGFEALKALAKKDCTSSEIKQRYFGPWDGSLYEKEVKIWVDRNRNGVSEPGEIISLKDAGVVAINSCHISHKEDKDMFGNGTALRSAFLFQSGEDITGNEAEILKRIDSGKTSDGKNADFRLAIDLIFKVRENVTLKD